MKRLLAFFFAGLLAFAPAAAVAQTVQGVSISIPTSLGAEAASLISGINAGLAESSNSRRPQLVRAAISNVKDALSARGNGVAATAAKKNVGKALAYVVAALKEIGGDEAAALVTYIESFLKAAAVAYRDGYNEQMAAFETARNVAGYQQKRTGQTIFYPDGFGSFVNPNAGSGATVVSPK